MDNKEYNIEINNILKDYNAVKAAGSNKVIEALKSSSGFIRSLLGKKVRMRNIPELLFNLDDSLEYGSYMDKKISEIVQKDEN